LTRLQLQSTEIGWEQIIQRKDFVGTVDGASTIKFYGKEVHATMGITLLFKVPTSDINEVKYDQGHQNKKGQ